MIKIKLFLESEKGKDILVILIIILVGLASFLLGRLSKQDSNNGGLKIENRGQEANIISSLESISNKSNEISLFGANTTENAYKTRVSEENAYFASKKGKKYYGTTCSAGKTIKEENRIYFSSKDEATRAGYELSSSCR
jgi:DNA/RNA endonuclease YhcR with UshA esterase domain